MSDSTESLRRKISSAGDLQSVVSTMKALAASSIGQYERSVRVLDDYHRTVALGLGACFRASHLESSVGSTPAESADDAAFGLIIFGSDQGLVGRFNEVIADFANGVIAAQSGSPRIWAVGERIHARLTDAGLAPVGLYPVPTSIAAVATLIGQIQVESEKHRALGRYSRVFVLHNRPLTGDLYEPVSQQLLPLDARWEQRQEKVRWPTAMPPEILGHGTATLRACIREYLFISLFRACAESLASENASRLSAMERAERNIDELLEDLHARFHRLRQESIDSELFDVISGFEALSSNQ